MGAASSGRRTGMNRPAGLCILLLFVAGSPARAESPGDALSRTESRQGRLVSLSIRIAQAEGNDAKLGKFKSLARQRRARKRVPFAPVNLPGKRVSRPGRTP